MKQILIVEDDSFLNKMVAYNLTADGYGVTSALNARTAADAIRQREFNLVLLDINLLEGYGNDNPGAKSQGMKQLMAGGGVALIGVILVPLLSGLFG